jgi:hypothetical protein
MGMVHSPDQAAPRQAHNDLTPCGIIEMDKAHQGQERHCMKKWEKPQLIVLVRSRPEEAVLQVCKWDFDGDPFNSTGSCIMPYIGCAPCSLLEAS